MAIDLKVFNHRNREIKRLVSRGSPALVYSGPFGIAIAAVLRPGVTWRVGKVMDRMAIIGRGDPVARDFIHKVASAEARSIAGKFSQGDVKGREPAHAVAAALQRQNNRYILAEALPVEACFVQLNATPEADYLAYIPFEGTVRSFRRAWFLGDSGDEESGREDSGDKESDDEESDDRRTTKSLQPEDSAARINDRLAELLDDYESFDDLREALAHLDVPAPVRVLRDGGTTLDVVVLDRAALIRHEYEKVFKRFTL